MDLDIFKGMPMSLAEYEEYQRKIFAQDDLYIKEMQAAQAQAQAYNMAQAAQNVPGGTFTGVLTRPPPELPPKATAQVLSERAREMFLKRMGGIRAELKIHADDYLHCHVYGDMVYLFYCFGGRDGCVKEGIDLFPTDQLITQFRMVLST